MTFAVNWHNINKLNVIIPYCADYYNYTNLVSLCTE